MLRRGCPAQERVAFISAAPAIFRLARGTLVVIAPLGIAIQHRERDDGPVQNIGVLVDLRGKYMRSERPITGRNRHGHIEQRREVLPHIES